MSRATPSLASTQTRRERLECWIDGRCNGVSRLDLFCQKETDVFAKRGSNDLDALPQTSWQLDRNDRGRQAENRGREQRRLRRHHLFHHVVAVLIGVDRKDRLPGNRHDYRRVEAEKRIPLSKDGVAACKMSHKCFEIRQCRTAQHAANCILDLLTTETLDQRREIVTIARQHDVEPQLCGLVEAWWTYLLRCKPGFTQCGRGCCDGQSNLAPGLMTLRSQNDRDARVFRQRQWMSRCRHRPWVTGVLYRHGIETQPYIADPSRQYPLYADDLLRQGTIPSGCRIVRRHASERWLEARDRTGERGVSNGACGIVAVSKGAYSGSDSRRRAAARATRRQVSVPRIKCGSMQWIVRKPAQGEFRGIAAPYDDCAGASPVRNYSAVFTRDQAAESRHTAAGRARSLIHIDLNRNWHPMKRTGFEISTAQRVIRGMCRRARFITIEIDDGIDARIYCIQSLQRGIYHLYARNNLRTHKARDFRCIQLPQISHRPVQRSSVIDRAGIVAKIPSLMTLS